MCLDIYCYLQSSTKFSDTGITFVCSRHGTFPYCSTQQFILHAWSGLFPNLKWVQVIPVCSCWQFLVVSSIWIPRLNMSTNTVADTYAIPMCFSVSSPSSQNVALVCLVTNVVKAMHVMHEMCFFQMSGLIDKSACSNNEKCGLPRPLEIQCHSHAPCLDFNKQHWNWRNYPHLLQVFLRCSTNYNSQDSLKRITAINW